MVRQILNLDASNNRVLARLIQRSRDLREMRDGLTSSAVRIGVDLRRRAGPFGHAASYFVLSQTNRRML